MEELKKASAGTDVAAITQAMEALTKAQHAAAESLYKNAQSPAAAAGGAGASGGRRRHRSRRMRSRATSSTPKSWTRNRVGTRDQG